MERILYFIISVPFLIEQFDVTGYDAVITSSAAFARGTITRPDQPHLCYVHSPARYAWDEQFSYLQQGRLGYGPKGMLYRRMLHNLRIWDVRTAHGPDLMLANSNFIRARIKRIYGRDVQVVMVVRPDTVALLPEGIAWLRDQGVRHVVPSLDLWTHWSRSDAEQLEQTLARCADLWYAGLPDYSIGWFDSKAVQLANLPTDGSARCGFGDGRREPPGVPQHIPVARPRRPMPTMPPSRSNRSGNCTSELCDSET